jgi:hypothetical protein
VLDIVSSHIFVHGSHVTFDPRRITVFVRYENVVRLLRFLGYCLE